MVIISANCHLLTTCTLHSSRKDSQAVSEQHIFLHFTNIQKDPVLDMSKTNNGITDIELKSRKTGVLALIVVTFRIKSGAGDQPTEAKVQTADRCTYKSK